MKEIEMFSKIGIWLVKQHLDTKAKIMNIKLENIEHKGKNLGNYEVKVSFKKLPSPNQ